MAIAKATAGREGVGWGLTSTEAARLLVNRERTVHLSGAGALDALVHRCRQYQLGAETERVRAGERESDRPGFTQ